MKIMVDGRVVLESGTGDGGKEDADQVWACLKKARFKATKEFAGLNVDADKETVAISGKAETGTDVTIDVDYGGVAETHEVHLIRIPRDELGREWRLDPKVVDFLFNSRLISREEAARLAAPKKLQ
jgi:hypothetical protein